MFKNRISGYFDRAATTDAAPQLDSPAASKQALPGGSFAIIPIAGMPNGFGPVTSQSSIYELARREAIEQSQERLLALLRSRWEFLNGTTP